MGSETRYLINLLRLSV